MAIKQRQRGRPPGRGSSFQRRLTWREIEAAFDHLFDISLRDQHAENLIVRFRRARSQLLPVFSSMVVSPYERERVVALDVLRRVGGTTTLKMVDELLADDDVQTAYKLDLRQLREQLALERRRPGRDEDEDEDEDEGDEAVIERADRADREADEATTEPAAEGAEPEPDGRSRRRAGRGRGRRRGRAAEPAEPSAEGAPSAAEPTSDTPLQAADPALFEGAATGFLEALAGPIEPVLAAFDALPLPKRLSFIDRSGRLDDDRVLAFLLPLLEAADWAIVQSALRAIGTLGRPAALPAVEKLAADSARKRVKLRAERVRDQLRALAPAGEEPAAPPAPEEPSSPRPKPQRRARVRASERPEEAPSEAATAAPDEPVLAPSDTIAEAPDQEPAAAPQPAATERRGRSRGRRDRVPELPPDADLGLLLPAAPPLVEEAAAPFAAPARLPKLVGCLASGLDASGGQRLYVYRAGDGETLDRLELAIHEQGGWLSAALTTGLAPGQLRLDQETPPAGGGLAETTVGYVRRRVTEAAALNAAADRPLPANAEAALAWIGTGRKTEVAAELPAEPTAPTHDQLDALLDHPLFTGWRLALDPAGEAVARWAATSGRRSASRVRRRLIDDLLAAWVTAGMLPVLVARLQLQALLLERAGAKDLAAVAGALAAHLADPTARHQDNLLLRELVYRGFQVPAPPRADPSATPESAPWTAQLDRVGRPGAGDSARRRRR